MKQIITGNKMDSINSYLSFTQKCKRLLFVAGLFMVAGTIQAQENDAELDKLFTWVTANSPGCVCAVSQNGKLVANKAYGVADLERSIPLTTHSVLDAGSVVKQFVAAAVLLLVEEGRLSLTEDIHKYIPELPDYGEKITLDHLLTHTSGIRDWTGLRPLAEGDPDALTLTLRQRGLNFKPGEEWAYSNSGYVLLKEIVARSSGKSFSEFTRKRLFEPLKMMATSYVQDLTGVIKNRALAYKKENDGWKLDMEIGNDRGGGGALFSTASDLVLWNEALAKNSLGAFVTEKLQQPAKLNNGRKLGYGRGLMIDTFRRGGNLVWHSGGAAGYSTLLARLPQYNLSLALMCNADNGARSALAARMFDLYLPSSNTGTATQSNQQPEAVTVDANDKAGLYFNGKTGQPLRLLVNNKALSLAGVGPLLALSADRFKSRGSSLSFLSGANFEMQFRDNSQFEIITSEGEKIPFTRAKGFAPTATELAAFAGKFESNDLGSVMEIVPEKESLQMRFFRNPAKSIKLTAVDKDTFMLAMMTVRFQRNKEGVVTGFLYSNPIVRNIEFTRIN
ncbi:MAG: serine hydrolase [Chitinophagaceae bacterium]|nr:MAG: serine hydrolase [Chitinophagaceae bacterium]